jgi:hypothetical protein
MGENDADNASQKTEQGTLTLQITCSMWAAGCNQIALNNALEAPVEPIKLIKKKMRGKK